MNKINSVRFSFSPEDGSDIIFEFSVNSMFSKLCIIQLIEFCGFFFQLLPAETKQTSLWLLRVTCHHCWVVEAQPNVVPHGVDFLLRIYAPCLWMKNVVKEMMERLDHIRWFLQHRDIDEMLRGVERSGASMTFCHVQYNGKLKMERCSHYTGLLVLNHFESTVTEHPAHTHIHRCMLLTGHNELNLLRYGGPQFVWGVTAICSLVLCKVPIIGYHKGPRIPLFHQPGV